MNLTYLQKTPETPSGLPALLVLHAEAAPPDPQLVARLSGSGEGRPVIAPFGDYAFYPSGMEIGGLSWYRVPGGGPADPITVCRAVLQVCDLIESAVDPSAGETPCTVVGIRQGAVVAVGAGLLRPDLVAAVVAIDLPAPHLTALPPPAWEERARPAFLLADVPPDTAPPDLPALILEAVRTVEADLRRPRR